MSSSSPVLRGSYRSAFMERLSLKSIGSRPLFFGVVIDPLTRFEHLHKVNKIQL